MAVDGQSGSWRRLVALIGLLLLVFLAIATVFFSYHSGLLFVIGLALGILLWLVVRAVRRRAKVASPRISARLPAPSQIKDWSLGLIALGVILLVVFFSFFGVLGNQYALSPGVTSLPTPPLMLESMQVNIRSTSAKNTFQITGNAVTRDRRHREQRIELRSMPKVQSTHAGLLLREVRVPLKQFVGNLLTQSEPDVGAHFDVTLFDFPKGSFYEARGASALPRKAAFLNTETVRWSLPTLDDGIAFAYTPKSDLLLRKVLSPGGWVASLGHWLDLFLGGVLNLVIGPLVGDEAKKLLARLKKRRRHASDEHQEPEVQGAPSAIGGRRKRRESDRAGKRPAHDKEG